MEEINADEPEKIAVSLQNLEKLIRDEKLLDCPKDERFLMKFLHARKYDADKAFKTVQKYFRARQSYPAIFESFTPSEVLYDTIFRENKLLAVSSKRDSLGRAVMLVKTGAWDASICTLDEFTKACMILIEWMLFDEEVQKRGVVYILDYKGLGLHHLTQYTPFAIQKMIHIAQVQLFGDDMEKLRDLVPDDVIPKEAGGTLESYDYDKLERDMLSQSDYFEELDRYGYGKESTRC
ncbi:alpha-tocopherol transfer protein-like isoform X2 [Dermacentor andersoni]|uniref:alpha-tocopherol transfer protein-like isoform X2 n=1 Tax=Dermacentor andersoni TaxID=34620 RepID=UPI003B3A8EE3